jgi:hypothetical protein
MCVPTWACQRGSPAGTPSRSRCSPQSARSSPPNHTTTWAPLSGVTCDHDLIIDRGKIRKRTKAASRRFRGGYGHTPLSAAEDIPWRCGRLVIGTGADGALPVMQHVREEARPPQDRPGCPARGRGDRRAHRGRAGHQRRPARYMLSQLAQRRYPAAAMRWHVAVRSSLPNSRAEADHHLAGDSWPSSSAVCAGGGIVMD